MQAIYNSSAFTPSTWMLGSLHITLNFFDYLIQGLRETGGNSDLFCFQYQQQDIPPYANAPMYDGYCPPNAFDYQVCSSVIIELRNINCS